MLKINSGKADMAIQTITIDTEQWAVVPRVPTQEMQKAGFIANNRVQGCSDPDEPCCYCGDGFGERDGCGHAAVAAYGAMLAAAPRPEAVQQPEPVVINLGKGDKLVADIYQDDEEGVIYKAGVGIFDPEPGKVYGIGVKDTRIDGMQISPDRNPLALIWSDKPESLQVIIDELQEAIGRLTGQQPTPRPAEPDGGAV